MSISIDFLGNDIQKLYLQLAKGAEKNIGDGLSLAIPD